MNRFSLAFGIVFCFAVRVAGADDFADAHTVIDRAIKAIGGREKLSKYPCAIWTAKGTVDGKTAMTGTWSIALPSRCRVELKIGDGRFVFVQDGDRRWTKNGDKPTEDEDGREWKDILYGSWVAGLTSLRDKAFTLSMLKEATVAERPAAGVKVTREGRPTVHLYFDKETGLLVKTVFFENEDLWMECVYSAYKDFDGFKHPTKAVMTERSKPFMEQEITEYKRLEKLDDALFVKP